MSGGNSWLARQRKSDLVELAQTIGLKDYEGLRKADLELLLDEHLSENATQYQANPKFNDYFKSRARAGGSPIKKEIAPPPEMKLSRRRSTKPTEEIIAAEEEEEDEEEEEEEEEEERPASSTGTALVRTPGRALTLAASRVQMLPATPADVARAVDRGTVAVRERVASLYHESGITEVTQTTREWLSTVQSVLASIALFELYRLRQEILPDRYAFTIPAIPFLGTDDYPVSLPDMFALVTAGFWGPALTWMLTSLVIPGVFGYFFNLSAAHNGGGHGAGGTRGRGRPATKPGHQQEYTVDPLTFSLVKAVATYVVYAQGVTFGGLISPETVARINGSLYSGWKGVLVGTAVAGVTAVYDAVLTK